MTVFQLTVILQWSSQSVIFGLIASTKDLLETQIVKPCPQTHWLNQNLLVGVSNLWSNKHFRRF